MGAIAANWKKRRLQVRRRFAGGSSSNSVLALAYIEIDRFVKRLPGQFSVMRSLPKTGIIVAAEKLASRSAPFGVH